MNHGNQLPNRLSSSRIDGQLPPFAWNLHTIISIHAVYKLEQQGFAFKYVFPTTASMKFSARSAYAHFMGLQSDDWLCRVYIPTTKTINIVRLLNFKPILHERLPGASTILDDGLSQTSFDEFSEGNHSQAEEGFLQAFRASTEILTCTTPIFQNWNQLVLKSFTEAMKNSQWCEAIDREVKALVKRQIWTYLTRPHAMNVSPITWVFRLKPIDEEDFKYSHKTRCIGRGDQQAVYFEFDLDSL